MTEDKFSVPQQTLGDAGHAVIKAGISVFPVIGGPALELFQHIVQAPLERRRERWMADVGEKLKELESQGVDLEQLQADEQFISVVMHASQVALRTHQQEKLLALRNAILNVAKGQALEETFQHLFLGFVDSFTGQHLRILKLFQAPNPPPNMSMGGLGHVLEHNIPELRGQTDLYGQLWKDLYSRGLVSPDGMNVTMSENGLRAKRTTSMGDSFITFITDSN